MQEGLSLVGIQGVTASPTFTSLPPVQTTLLSILGGRAPKQTRQEGRVLFNGHKLTKRVKRQIGFVLQVRAGWSVRSRGLVCLGLAGRLSQGRSGAGTMPA